MNTKEWKVLNPVGAVDIEDHGGAERFDDFAGKRIGLWWNGKPNGDVFLNEVARQLESRGITTVRIWELAPSTTRAYGLSKEQLGLIARSADMVIGGLAD